MSIRNKYFGMCYSLIVIVLSFYTQHALLFSKTHCNFASSSITEYYSDYIPITRIQIEESQPEYQDLKLLIFACSIVNSLSLPQTHIRLKVKLISCTTKRFFKFLFPGNIMRKEKKHGFYSRVQNLNFS